jgi:hypothetical protein
LAFISGRNTDKCKYFLFKDVLMLKNNNATQVLIAKLTNNNKNLKPCLWFSECSLLVRLLNGRYVNL